MITPIDMNKDTKANYALLIWVVSFWILTAISPLNRHDWLLENIIVLIFFAAIVLTYKKFKFSTTSYILVTLFITLHLIGAHYTYERVPLGFFLSDLFELKRNHFDRIVHFSFGLLLTYPIREFLVRKANLKGFLSYYLPADVIFACSALFEIIEWIAASLVSPDTASDYLGTQGDIWDAQKDMASAAIGAVVALVLIYTTSLLRKSKN